MSGRLLTGGCWIGLLGLLSLAGLLMASCGCMNMGVGELTIEPPTACLDLSLPGKISNCATASGLVLSGRNNCAETLTLPGSFRVSPAQDLVVEPGGEVEYRIAWSIGTPQEFAIPATLGEAEVVLHFDTR